MLSGSKLILEVFTEPVTEPSDVWYLVEFLGLTFLEGVPSNQIFFPSHEQRHAPDQPLPEPKIRDEVWSCRELRAYLGPLRQREDMHS